MASGGVQRFSGFCLLAGLAVVTAATLVHPPTFDPRAHEAALAAGASGAWVLDHWALFGGTVLIGVGLSGFHAALLRTPAARPAAVFSAALLALTSFVLWLLLFAFEATGWNVLAEMAAPWAEEGGRAAGAPASVATAVAPAAWRTLIGGGHAAGLLAAAAVSLWSRAARRARLLPRWSYGAAAAGAALVAAFTPAGWAAPAWGVPVLAAGYLLIGAWLAAVAWRLCWGIGE